MRLRKTLNNNRKIFSKIVDIENQLWYTKCIDRTNGG